MLPQAADFRAEADELRALLVTLQASDWGRPTLFKQWTVNDIVQHLQDGDLMAGLERHRDGGAHARNNVARLFRS